MRPSETVRLDCAVDGDPKPQIYWQFNFGNDFPAAKERRMRVMPGDEAFIIEDAKPSDRGVYTCTAENPAGIITTNVTVEIRKLHELYLNQRNKTITYCYLLIIFPVDQPTFVQPLQSKEAVVGVSASLECSDGDSSFSDIRWYKNNLPISATDHYLFTNGKQMLIIAKTTEKDAGIYTCETENSIGKQRLLINLTIRQSISTVVSETNDKNVNLDEITAIIIITVVCCATCTSIVWAIVIYKTKQIDSCGGGNDTVDGHTVSGIENHFNKENNLGVLSPNGISMLPEGSDRLTQKSMEPLRTATVSKCRVLRSSSGSSCDHSSVGVSDDIFCDYNDDRSMNNTLLHQQFRNVTTDSDEDEPNNDHEALLGTQYYEQYSNSITPSNKCSDNDSYIVQMNSGTNCVNSQNNSIVDNASTAECRDFDDDDDDQHSSIKTKTSVSLNSSCHSIPAFTQHKDDANRSNVIHNSVSTPPLSTFSPKLPNERKHSNSVATMESELKSIPKKSKHEKKRHQ